MEKLEDLIDSLPARVTHVETKEVYLLNIDKHKGYYEVHYSALDDEKSALKISRDSTIKVAVNNLYNWIYANKSLGNIVFGGKLKHEDSEPNVVGFGFIQGGGAHPESNIPTEGKGGPVCT